MSLIAMSRRETATSMIGPGGARKRTSEESARSREV